MTVTPTFEELSNSFMEALSTRCNINNFSEGSAAGMIVNMIATEMRRLYV